MHWGMLTLVEDINNAYDSTLHQLTASQLYRWTTFFAESTKVWMLGCHWY
jgi:hypothetical protein